MRPLSAAMVTAAAVIMVSVFAGFIFSHLPRWLDRILPDVDVEGASLSRREATPASGELVH